MLRDGFAILSLLLMLMPGAGTEATDPSAAELLEKGIYTEETVGDLDAAIAIYDRIVVDTEAERPYVAQALYRLGKCLLKSGNDDRAIRTFEKLVAEYPEQADLVAKAREHLPVTEQTSGGLTLDPAPWEDGELLRFVLKTPSGQSVGDLSASVRSTNVDGREAWRVEAYMGIPKPEVAKYVHVEADRESFRPINTMLYHSQLGTLRAHFTDSERQIKMNRPGEEPEPYTQKLADVTYDNEQVLYLVRRLPLASGYKTSFLLTGRPGATAVASLEVVGIESVTVPAGTFECFKVEIGVPPAVETQWFSTDANRYVVKVGNPQIIVELTEIDRLPKGPVRFEDEAAGISMTAPRGWDITKSAFRFGEHEFWLLIFPPELKAKGVFVAQKPPTPMSIREFAAEDVEIYRSRRESYAVREDSWAELEVAGAQAVSLLADLEAENQAMVDYRVYVAGPSAYYWFVFRAAVDEFESMKDDFEGVVHSLKLE
jgi:hypothetical protein